MKCCTIPLRGQNSSLLGLLYLDTRATTHDFTKTRRDILEAIAIQAATLLENLRMLDHTRRESLTDALTGLGNRRCLMGELPRALEQDAAYSGSRARPTRSRTGTCSTSASTSEADR